MAQATLSARFAGIHLGWHGEAVTDEVAKAFLFCVGTRRCPAGQISAHGRMRACAPTMIPPVGAELEESRMYAHIGPMGTVNALRVKSAGTGA